jgi:hypothetical protein
MKRKVLVVGFLVPLLLLLVVATGRSSWAAPHLAVTDLQYDGHVIDDDGSGGSVGNGDGVANCGETIELYVALENPATDLAVLAGSTLSSTDPYITGFGNTSSSYPLIPMGASEINDTAFVFTLDTDVPDGHAVHFDLFLDAPEGPDASVEFDVVVNRHCAADVTCDGQVDVADVSALAAVWRSDVGSDSIYDLDGDGIVTVVDILRVASQWQSSCP